MLPHKSKFLGTAPAQGLIRKLGVGRCGEEALGFAKHRAHRHDEKGGLGSMKEEHLVLLILNSHYVKSGSLDSIKDQSVDDVILIQDEVLKFPGEQAPRQKRHHPRLVEQELTGSSSGRN